MAAILILATLPAAPPARAATVSATLRWTAPGDDGVIGRAQAYALRYSTAPITAANFNAATPATGLPAPGLPGSTEVHTLTGLAAGTLYYVAIKTADEAGNWSAISNVATVLPPTTAAGDVTADFSFSNPWPNPARASLRLAFALPRAAEVEVDAFGVSGRHVRKIASGWRAAGPWELDWDLRDDGGRSVPAGVYLIRARLGEGAWSRRVTVVR